MLQFIEASTAKKIQIAECIHVHHGKSHDDLMVKLHLSNLTFNMYLEEVYGLYAKFRGDDPLYSESALREIIQFYIRHSVKLLLLRNLVFHPGETSGFYRKKLGISPATFTRSIGQLKALLRKFNMEIQNEEGYFIKGTNKIEEVMLCSYVASSFSVDSNEVEQLILQFSEGQKYLEKLRAIDFSLYKFSEYPFEKAFFVNLILFTVLRGLQYNEREHEDHEINIQTVIDHIKSVFEQNELANHDYFADKINKISIDLVPISKRAVLLQLLMKTNFHLELFPYEIRLFDLRQAFFIHKVYEKNPNSKKIIDQFIKDMSNSLNIDFYKREISIIYFLIAEGMLHLEPKTYFQLYDNYSVSDKPQIEYLTLNGFVQFSRTLCDRMTQKLSYPA